VEMSDVFTNQEVLVAHANARLNLHGRRLLVSRVIDEGRPSPMSPRNSASPASAPCLSPSSGAHATKFGRKNGADLRGSWLLMVVEGGGFGCMVG
jgi:hypothetical protein